MERALFRVILSVVCGLSPPDPIGVVNSFPSDEENPEGMSWEREVGVPVWLGNSGLRRKSALALLPWNSALGCLAAAVLVTGPGCRRSPPCCCRALGKECLAFRIAARDCWAVERSEPRLAAADEVSGAVTSRLLLLLVSIASGVGFRSLFTKSSHSAVFTETIEAISIASCSTRLQEKMLLALATYHKRSTSTARRNQLLLQLLLWRILVLPLCVGSGQRIW